MWSPTDDNLKILAQGKLEWPMASIKLSEPRLGAAQETYSGNGWVRQKDDGSLEFRMFVSERSGTTQPRFGKAGVIIGEEHYYALEATHMDGEIWHCPRVLPTPHQYNQSLLVEGQIDTLSQEHKTEPGPADKAAYLKMVFLTPIESFPWNRPRRLVTHIDGEYQHESSSMSVAKFEACNCSFKLEKIESIGVELVVTGATIEQNPFFPMRVVEALQFILGREMHWNWLQVWTATRYGAYLNGRRHSQSSRLPPLSLSFGTCHQDVFRIFEDYLKYVLLFDKERVHRVSEILCGIHRAQDASIDAWALTVSVAAEALLMESCPLRGKPSNDEQAAFDRALALLKEQRFEDRVGERLEGAIRALSHPRAKDAFRELIKEGAVRQGDFDAWDKLRNRAAHGASIDRIQPQELVDYCNAVMVLCYHLIFQKIGYQGKSTDYARYGYPDIEYPIQRNEATQHA
ncbi:MAG: hypothetical protein NTW87_24945 [Planctomycetota bacterium]|nr:hypothetical protein [Planctomycetota bacterium]